MIRWAILGASALAVAGCTSQAAAPEKPATAAAMKSGQWEVTAKVTALQLADKAAAGKLKVGDTATATGCVGADGTPDPALFAATADTCTPVQSYAANGRLSVQLNCSRAGHSGQILPQADGSFTADSLNGTVTTMAYGATGRVEYTLSQAITGKRVGECKPA